MTGAQSHPELDREKEIQELKDEARELISQLERTPCASCGFALGYPPKPTGNCNNSHHESTARVVDKLRKFV